MLCKQNTLTRIRLARQLLIKIGENPNIIVDDELRDNCNRRAGDLHMAHGDIEREVDTTESDIGKSDV